MSDAAIPAAIGRYEILERLGEGGMGEVFLARTRGVEGFSKPVVIKRLLPKLAHSPKLVALFVAEAKLAARLQHRNVVQVHDLGDDRGALYIVMEYVAGTDLAHLLRTTVAKNVALPVWFSLHVAIEMLGGLACLHESTDETGRRLNAVHRDVSPANVFVSFQGDVKLGDFGVAKSELRDDQTRAGEVRGKIAYLSPEQIIGRNFDARADLFSAAIVLWECLAQRRLFGGRPDYQSILAITQGPRPPPSEYNPRVTPELDALVGKALSVSPDERFQSALEFQRALAEIQQKYGHVVVGTDVRDLLLRLAANGRMSQPETSGSEKSIARRTTLSPISTRAKRPDDHTRSLSEVDMADEPPAPQVIAGPPESMSPRDLNKVPDIDALVSDAVSGGKIPAAPPKKTPSQRTVTPIPGLGPPPPPTRRAVTGSHPLNAVGPDGNLTRPPAPSGPARPAYDPIAASLADAPRPRPPDPASTAPPRPAPLLPPTDFESLAQDMLPRGTPSSPPPPPYGTSLPASTFGALPTTPSAPSAPGRPSSTFGGLPANLLPSNTQVGPLPARAAPMSYGSAPAPKPPSGFELAGDLTGADAAWAQLGLEREAHVPAPVKPGAIPHSAPASHARPAVQVVMGQAVVAPPPDDRGRIVSVADSRASPHTPPWVHIGMAPGAELDYPPGTVHDGGYRGPHAFWLKNQADLYWGPVSWSALSGYLANGLERSAHQLLTSADGQTWLDLEQVGSLLGIESWCVRSPSSIQGRMRGHLRKRSLTSVLAALWRNRETGRLVLSAEDPLTDAWRELHVIEGVPTFVTSNAPRGSLLDALVKQHLVRPDQVDAVVHGALMDRSPVELAARKRGLVDVDQNMPLVVRERAVELFGWRLGQFVFEQGYMPLRVRPIAKSCLALATSSLLKAMSERELLHEVGSKADKKLTPTTRFDASLAELGFNDAQAEVARLLSRGQTVNALLRRDGVDHKVLAQVAYILTEAELLVPPRP